MKYIQKKFSNQIEELLHLSMSLRSNLKTIVREWVKSHQTIRQNNCLALTLSGKQGNVWRKLHKILKKPSSFLVSAILSDEDSEKAKNLRSVEMKF